MTRQIELAEASFKRGYLTASFGFDTQLNALIQTVPGRHWDMSRKVWIFPATPESLDVLVVGCKACDVQLMAKRSLLAEIERSRAGLAAAKSVKAAGDADIVWPLRTTPYAHQRASLAFLTHLGSGALLHEMGTGKTACAIAFAEWLMLHGPEKALALPRVLVICPNSVKRNWAREIEKHTGRADDALIPDGTLLTRAQQIRKGVRQYTIVNCEALSTKVMTDALMAVRWDLVIADESTRFKNPSAKRTKALHKLNARRRVILTGSPITGAPQDAWAQFEFVSPGLFGSWWHFSDSYLQKGFFKEIIGVKPEMRDTLRQKIDSRSYRVLKADVLDLPEKVYQDRIVEMGEEQDKAYRQMRDELRVKIDGLPESQASIILTQLLRLTQITAGLIGQDDKYAFLTHGGKIEELDNLLNDELAGEQVIIFANYQRELEELSDRYGGNLHSDTGRVNAHGQPTHGYRPIIYGPTPEKIRHELVTQFQAGERRLLFAQAHSGGIGIDLFAAQTAIFYTRSWNAEDYWQAQDRLHRIGQKGTVTIVNLICRNTVDEQISKALASKRNLADILTGDDLRVLAREVLR